MFEVVTQAPRRLFIACQHPLKPALFSVSISVQLGGRVSAAAHMAAGDEVRWL